MNLLLAAACSLYGVLALGISRPIAGDFAWRMYDAGRRSYYTRHDQTKPYAYQWITSGVLAFGVALVWPLVLVGLLAWRLGGRYEIGREREVRTKERARYIAELEKKAGIR